MKKFDKILKWIFGVFIVCVFLFVIFSVKTDYEIPFEKVSVNYLNKNLYKNFSEEHIIDEVKSFMNAQDSLKDINTSLLEDLILENIYINKAEVYLGLDEIIHVYIKFREPFVKVLRDNKIQYYDDDGELLPPLLSAKQLLIISGEAKDIKTLLPLITDIYNDELLNDLIGGIYCDSDKVYVLSSTICDLGIKIGDVGEFDIKHRLNTIELFFNFFTQNLKCDDCEIISLEYDNQIICIN